jgi:hypothetical protein
MDAMASGEHARSHPLLDPKTGIYRKPSKEETAILAVDQEILHQYAEFLKQPNTGLVKLNADSACVSRTDAVVVSANCLRYKIPGAGAAFSFRSESYRIPQLADIILFYGVLRNVGVLQQLIITNVDAADLSNVGLDAPEVKYLSNFPVVSDAQELTEKNKELYSGINVGGRVYRLWQPLADKTTYILRSVAFRGRVPRSIDGIEYDELSYDRRRDIIVAFRVVNLDPDGNPTLAWKVLQDVEAPKFKR